MKHPNPSSVSRSLAAVGRAAAGISLLTAAPLVRAEYPSTVLADAPKAYYRFNDAAGPAGINVNSGSLGAAGNATNDLPTGVVHPFPGAIVGDPNRSSFFDFTTRTEIPWSEAINPANDKPFTVEAWFYPASDQTGTGQCPLNNRYAWSGEPNRTGWVFFQRKPSADYNGSEPVGWNFRMFNGIGTSGRLDVTSLVPYQVGTWQHVVVVYDPVDVTNATVTMYINGVAANTNVWTGGSTGTDPGYKANANNEAKDAAKLAIGNYNNTAANSLNPYFGAVDEFALYADKLSPAQILAHYQNATNASRSTPYDALIKSHKPVVYLRLDEIAPGPDTAVNLGETRAAGHGTHSAEIRHPATSALKGRLDDGSAAYHTRNGKATTTIPWSKGNNPGADVPFTFEAWLRPMRDAQGGQCPVNNRMVNGTGRTGWVIFQRNPNLSYPSSEGHGWNFRMYKGSGTGGQDILTETDYKIGEWQHLVVTWEPKEQKGDDITAANGNDQWEGILTAYVNGVPVATNSSALYAANQETPEAGQNNGVPADLAIGAYNAASGLGNNAYEGDVDEVAIYSDYILTPEQIAAHYAAGTNAHPAVDYATLVLTAPFTGPERKGPQTYLRFSDPARNPAANSGVLGGAADGNLVLASNTANGPANAGFGSGNKAVQLDGQKSWISLNRPADMNIAGQITLEAWIKPDATQSDSARIISHGPQTLSSFLATDPRPDFAQTKTAEVFLRIEGAGTLYSVGSTRADVDNTGVVTTETFGVTAPVPQGDLGGASWIHLVGTYDGKQWSLYRNGQLLASASSATGALPVPDTDWAIGSIGNGWEGTFAGAVDEVAIYDKALPAARITAHYASIQTATTDGTLTITRNGASVTLSYPAGFVLQESGSVTGSFTPVQGASSPSYTTTATGTKFYRIRPL